MKASPCPDPDVLPAESKKQVTRAFSSERFETGEGDGVPDKFGER
jgi:hypothetical protein